MKNPLGIDIPDHIEDYGDVRQYKGAFGSLGTIKKYSPMVRCFEPGDEKLLESISMAIEKTGLQNGMTVSFHHHLRNGDKTVNLVMAAIDEAGLKDIHLAASGLFPCHEPLVDMMERGVITKVTTSTFNPGAVAKAITAGKLKNPAVLMSHGGRARAIERGDLQIDVAFIAAPSCDIRGNMNGTQGKSACGYLSYSYADAQYAGNVVAITDELVRYPCCPAEISQDLVDYVVKVDSIGDPKGIVSGTTKITDDPVRLQIADNAAMLAAASGYIKQNMSFQTGASSTALAVAAKVREIMIEKNITGSFGLGGIHAFFVKMLEEGLFQHLQDVQCFDLEAVASAGSNEKHIPISGSRYANPHNKGSVVNDLDIVILGATEIDVDFNVNVVTGSNGVIMGASGGHSDCAAGSKLCIVVANLTRKQFCIVRDRVTTITTPGETVDAFVTEHGIAINPLRTDLISAVKDSGLPVTDIHKLKAKGEELAGEQHSVEVSDRVVGIVEYRDGTVIDLVRQPLNEV